MSRVGQSLIQHVAVRWRSWGVAAAACGCWAALATHSETAQRAILLGLAMLLSWRARRDEFLERSLCERERTGAAWLLVLSSCAVSLLLAALVRWILSLQPVGLGWTDGLAECLLLAGLAAGASAASPWLAPSLLLGAVRWMLPWESSGAGSAAAAAGIGLLAALAALCAQPTHGLLRPTREFE